MEFIWEYLAILFAGLGMGLATYTVLAVLLGLAKPPDYKRKEK